MLVSLLLDLRYPTISLFERILICDSETLSLCSKSRIIFVKEDLGNVLMKPNSFEEVKQHQYYNLQET